MPILQSLALLLMLAVPARAQGYSTEKYYVVGAATAPVPTGIPTSTTKLFLIASSNSFVIANGPLAPSQCLQTTAGGFVTTSGAACGSGSSVLPSTIAYTTVSNTFTSSQTFKGNVRTLNNILDDGLGNMRLTKNVTDFDTAHFSSITVFDDGNVEGLIQPNQANPGVQLTGYTRTAAQSCYIAVAGGSYTSGACRQGFNGGTYSAIYYDNAGNASLAGGNAGSPSGGPYVQIGVNGSGGVNGNGNISGLDLNGQGFQTDGNGNFKESQSLYVNTGNNSLAPAFQVNDSNGNPAFEVYNGDGGVGDYVITVSNTLDDGAGNLTATSVNGNGYGLTDLNGNNVVNGTVGASYLPADVAYKDVAQTWTAAQSFSTMTVRNASTFISSATFQSTVAVYGLFVSSTVQPSISCSAGTGVMLANSNSQSGSFTAGTLATSCTLTFATSARFTKTPSCLCNAQLAGLVVNATSPSTTGFTCAATTALTGDTINYVCFGAP